MFGAVRQGRRGDVVRDLCGAARSVPDLHARRSRMWNGAETAWPAGADLALILPSPGGALQGRVKSEAFAKVGSRRHGLRQIFVVKLVFDRREGAERFGRERDRLTVAVGRCRDGTRCRRLAGQRVKGGADASTQLDQFPLAAACGDRECQRMQVASAITE